MPEARSYFRVELADGTTFRCAEDQTILRAALSSGLDVPYECASGSCGSCKCRLMEGSVAPLWPDAPGLSARDRRKGDRILTCQSLPQSDLRVGLRSRGPSTEPEPISGRARIESIESLNSSVLRVVLRKGGPAVFLPGQFVLLEIPQAGRRAYSMANLPNAEGRLEFLIKKKPGGSATAFLFERLAGVESIRIEGPYGRAYLRERSPRPIVAVAGGSGLAPMLSIVRGALERPEPPPVELWFGVKRPEEMFELEALRYLEDAGPVQTHVVLQERSEAVDHPRSQAGFVGEALVASGTSFEDKDLYLAGPTPMVDDLLARTIRAGRVDASRVYFDRFE